MVRNIVNPTPTEAIEFIKTHHTSKSEKTMVLLIGDCMIDYHGRARSLLDWGQRVVMIKQDGTILVHQPIMREPVNWQPSGAKTEYHVKDGYFILKAYHHRPPEKMKITFRELFMVTVTALHDPANLVIAGMEADVVNQIMCNPGMIEEDLRISKREKPVRSGMIDLFGYDKNHTPVVIEVKRSMANISAVQQLRIYVNDIKKDVEEANVRGILCAPRIPEMVKKLLSDYNLEWREVEREIILPDDLQKTLKDF